MALQTAPPPPTFAGPLPLAARTLARRDRLIAAIARVVVEEGYAGASVSKIVAAAGVSRNCFYEHFPNKEECFLAAYRSTVERVMARVETAVGAAPDRRGALEAGFAAFLGFGAEDPDLAWLAVVEVLAAGPRALALRDAAMARFAAFLERTRDVGGDDVPGVHAAVVVGGLYEAIYARVLAGRAASLPDLLPDVTYVWLVPFAGPARAARAAAPGRRAAPPIDGGR